MFVFVSAVLCPVLEHLELDHVGEVRNPTAEMMTDTGLQHLEAIYFTHTPVSTKALLTFYSKPKNLLTQYLRSKRTFLNRSISFQKNVRSLRRWWFKSRSRTTSRTHPMLPVSSNTTTESASLRFVLLISRWKNCRLRYNIVFHEFPGTRAALRAHRSPELRSASEIVTSKPQIRSFHMFSSLRSIWIVCIIFIVARSRRGRSYFVTSQCRLLHIKRLSPARNRPMYQVVREIIIFVFVLISWAVDNSDNLWA